MINKTSDTKFIIIQVVLTLFIAFIPIYFYLNASYENQKIQDKLTLKDYASSVIHKMHVFEEENNDYFYYPRSNIFTSALYDQNNQVIFSLFAHDEQYLFDESYFENNTKICYKQYLQKNSFGAKYIIVCKNKNYSQVILNAIILLLTITCLIFLSSFFIIKQSTEPYKKLNKYLDNFLKDAMHELKTPIGVARFNIDLLQMKIKDDKHILRIKSALKNMTVVYEDLEYYIHSHTVKEIRKEIDFSNFLLKRIEFFNDLASAKKIQLNCNIEKNIHIYFNELQLYRIIDNNLSNAIKYSKENTTILVSLDKKDEKIILIFKDQGIGIKDTQKIFNRYYRGDKISGGFGIGLNIVKNICVKNNIDIKVDSELKKGSCFTYLFNL